VKPFRGKRRGPQSLCIEFNLLATRRLRFRNASRQPWRERPGGGGRTFGVQSATTGFSAVRSVRGRWPLLRRWCYRPELHWPAGRPRKTLRGRLRALPLRCRSNWGDCCQCPLTAVLQRVAVSWSHLASVANRSVTCPTRLETRTKESNMCASRWASTKP
jgi:hypothetical protein